LEKRLETYNELDSDAKKQYDIWRNTSRKIF
jgi:hypothetical protein